MHFNPYGGAAAQIAAALVNAGPGTAAELSAVLREHGATMGTISPAEAGEVFAWAKRLRAVFEASSSELAVDLVNELLADSACRPFVSRHDGLRAHLHYAREDEGVLRRIRAYTAGGLAHLVCEDPDRFGRCAREGCATVFVDTSRNGRRRFCSTRCATRVHVAEHRVRAAAAG
ncbi:CGNR zinc finger domain-containing protein [Amycolatopsis sp. CA-230715]|uniref:CGNR zinc finger domain-containing protein n=1 Tax=Amycolatopsis sp. CA-230715 TaxID=2745196 RepID=UPI001C01099D|nr:CGNR zinc finger domain-containing protein [Amycolatopsis sp. CA-230715]QWF85041.1 hypothetical protein HUW46_08494 [Amycolatopsis sp. CA-230715]